MIDRGAALHWLIQANQDDRRAIATIEDQLDVLGVRWTEVEIDLSSPALPSLAENPGGARLLCHGPSFVRRIEHGAPDWPIGCIFDPAAFRWSRFREAWNGLMLSRDGRPTTVAVARDHPPAVPVFVRPDADSKAFDGGVRSPTALKILLDRLPSDLAIVVAAPEPIDAEYRLFVVDSEVVAASEYRRDGRPSTRGHVPDAVVDVALAADRIWRPARAYVLDVARSGSRHGIVEANCIMAARFYEADIRAVVTALCRAHGWS